MQITIGQTSDDRRKINKSFDGVSITVTPKQPCNVLHPVFILAWSSDYATANYLYCPDLGRYYYIDNVTLLTGARAEIQCSVDVLMSYKEEILSLEAYVVRNSTERDKLVYDASYPEQVLSTVCNLKFNATPFSVDGGYNTVLAVIGGRHVSEEE